MCLTNIKPFQNKVLSKLVLEKNFLNIIRDAYEKPIANIMFNGKV